MRVSIIPTNDGAAFQWGPDGVPHSFTVGDDDSLAIAFTKAVNDAVESGDEIEGEAAIKVAEVLKQAGDLAWPASSGYDCLRDAVCDALPKKTENGMTYCPWYVKDVALDCAHALICGYVDGEDVNYVVPITCDGSGQDMTVVVGDKSQWVEVEQEFVAKAGRMFSARNLTAMTEARDALDKLIQAATPKDDAPEVTKETGDEVAYVIEKADTSMRYTLGPLYAPMRKDAHGEYVEDDELHKSLHEFVRDSAETGRRINLQHGSGEVTVGEWVEAVRWPYDHVVKMTDADGLVHEVDMPAGTVYLGVVWDEDYWDVTKNAPKGLNGFSLGGRAVKVRGDGDANTLKDMGYKVRKSGPTVEPEVEYDPLDAVREAALLDAERSRSAIEQERERAAKAESLVLGALDAIKAVGGNKSGDTHVHVPETKVNLNVRRRRPAPDSAS